MFYRKGTAMKMSRFVRALRSSAVLLLGISAVSLAPVMDAAHAEDLRKVSIRLDWLPVAQHAGYYAAKAKGFYKKAGLDVTIVSGTGSSQVVQQVAAGNDTFGNAYGLGVIFGRANGAPVKAVANYNADAQASLTVLDSSGIKTAKDLKGKIVAHGTGSPFAAFLPIIWKSAGLSDKDVNVQAVAAAAAIPSLAKGNIDAFLGNSWEEPISLEHEFHKKGTALLFSDYGAGFLGACIIVNEQTLAKDPAMVQAFVKASIEGWRYAFEHPDEAGKIMGEANKGVSGAVDAKSVTEAQAILKQGAIYPALKGQPYGSMSAAEWQDTIDKMVNYLGLKNAPKAEDLFTNEFVKSEAPLK